MFSAKEARDAYNKKQAANHEKFLKEVDSIVEEIAITIIDSCDDVLEVKYYVHRTYHEILKDILTKEGYAVECESCELDEDDCIIINW